MAGNFSKSGRLACILILAASISNAQTRREDFRTDPCAPVASCPNASNTHAPPPPMSEEERRLREEPKSSKNDLKLALLIMVAIIAAAILANELTGKKWAKAEDLDANGPRFPDAQALGRFQVQGYAEPGWPFAVDFEALPGTETWLQIDYEDGKRRGQREFPLPYVEGRHIAVIHLPESDRPRTVARYTLHSAIKKPGEQHAYQPLKVYGLGAGPNAVGSLYLFVRDFGPTKGPDPNQVGYTIEAKRPFSRSQIEVLKLPKPGGTKYTRMATVSTPFIPNQSNRGSWAGMPFQPRPGIGVYQLQARAWGTADGGKDWTGALAPNYVSIVRSP